MSGAVLAREWGGVGAGVGGVGGVGTGASVGTGGPSSRALRRWSDRRQPTRANWRSAARWRRWRGSEF